MPVSSVLNDTENHSEKGIDREIIDLIDYRTTIKTLIRKLEGTAGLYIQAANERIRMVHNGDLLFPAASLIKLPIYFEYLNRIRKGDLDPARKITLSKESIAGGHGILKNEPLNSVHELKKIAKLMITVSDNSATNFLIDILSLDRINHAAKTLGMRDTVLQRKMMDLDSLASGKDNHTTARDIYVFLDEILHPKVISPEIGLEIINTLKHQELNTKLPSRLPSSTVIAHKTGELDGVEHDAGLIFSGKKWCIVVVLTKDLGSNDDGVLFCREIGRLIYNVIFLA